VVRTPLYYPEPSQIVWFSRLYVNNNSGKQFQAQSVRYQSVIIDFIVFITENSSVETCFRVYWLKSVLI